MFHFQNNWLHLSSAEVICILFSFQNNFNLTLHFFHKEILLDICNSIYLSLYLSFFQQLEDKQLSNIDLYNSNVRKWQVFASHDIKGSRRTKEKFLPIISYLKRMFMWQTDRYDKCGLI
jgi:hypothetical protein